MKPIVEQYGKNKYLIIFYISIFIICVVCIVATVFFQFSKDNKTNGAVIGNETQEKIQEDDEYNNLKAEFSSLFINNLDVIQSPKNELLKLSEEDDIIVTAYTYDKMDSNVMLKAYIPYFNINTQTAISLNKEIKKKFKDKAEEINNLAGITENTIYTVTYKAYLQNDILSLVIRSELKEGSKSQKIEIQTYNYNLKDEKEVTLQELLDLKNVSVLEAEFKINNEIIEIQKHSEALTQALAEQGSLFKRDYKSDMYKIENTNQYFLGKNGMLYVIYPYGNTYNTSEMDVIIFK